ncbi:hypothetical protein [Streptomyces sp. SID161]|uniref:hypothetical protein n=1 Tax=Streptomyces sp. SID161 TaxID=2690251 RepID=UPI00136D8ECB|nr:hypothetical protein [Streptomyces sp. SID161]MYW47854.1 hypothetical protein [Streptomyces sp. SID161]
MSTSKPAAAARPHRRPVVRRAVTTVTATGLVLAGAGLLSPAAHAAESDISFSAISLNKGKAIVVGTSGEVEVPLTYTVKSKVALDSWWIKGYRGAYGKFGERDLPAIATRWSVRTSHAGGYTFRDCSESLTIASRELVNADATTWKTAGTAIKKGSGYDTDLLSASFRLQRASRIQSASASPTVVTKGKAITVSGTVQRANWTSHRYDSYGGTSVRLQFKPVGSSTYTTVKTVTATSTGHLKTTATASKDGTWRWFYGGNSITGASSSTGKYVDVR